MMNKQNIQLVEKLRESIKRLEGLRELLSVEKEILLQQLKGKYQFLKQKLKESMEKTKYLENILHIKTIEADNLKKLSNEVINSRSTLQ